MKQKTLNTTVSESKGRHTTGKWETFIQYATDGSVRTINVGSKRLATLCHVGIEESEANARLISAAPDMLEALKEAERSLETLSEADCFDKHDRKALNLCSAIIAKATNNQ